MCYDRFQQAVWRTTVADSASIRWPEQSVLAGARRGRDSGVVDALVALIESESLGVGDRLPPEIELAERLGVARSSIREVLKSWQSMGIVTRNKGAGTTLSAEISSRSIHLPLTLKLEAESLIRTHAVRRPLEIEASRLAARNATEQERKVILARVAELDAVYEAGEDWRPADHRFHAAIHDATGNPLFGQLIWQIHHAFHDIYDTPFGKAHLGESTIPFHRPLAEAIVTRDETKAAELTAKILDIVEAEVRQELEVGNA